MRHSKPLQTHTRLNQHECAADVWGHVAAGTGQLKVWFQGGRDGRAPFCWVCSGSRRFLACIRPLPLLIPRTGKEAQLASRRDHGLARRCKHNCVHVVPVGKRTLRNLRDRLDCQMGALRTKWHGVPCARFGCRLLPSACGKASVQRSPCGLPRSSERRAEQ